MVAFRFLIEGTGVTQLSIAVVLHQLRGILLKRCAQLTRGFSPGAALCLLGAWSLARSSPQGHRC